MAWKCSKCGMPNFEDDACKLCGALKPENPEEFIEETTEPVAEASEPEFEPVVVEYGPAEEETPAPEVASEPEPEISPEPEIIPEPEVAPESEVEAEPEPEAEPEIVQADEPEVVPEVEAEAEAEIAPVVENETNPANEPEATVIPAPEHKPKKRSKLPWILLIWLLILASAAYYLFVIKGNTENKGAINPSSAPTATQSAAPSLDPVIEEPELPEESPAFSEAPVESEAPAITTVSPAPTAAPVVTPATTVVPKKTPVPAPKVTKRYKIYTSNDYSFYAAYPVEFSEKANLHSESLLRLAAYEDKVDMVIGGTKNWKKLSAKAALKQFLSYFSGTVVASDSGDTWYTATVNENGRVTRRKAFVKNGNICYVEFTYQETDEAEFLPCMNYVLDNFITMN